MFDIMTRFKVQILREAGHTQAEVAHLAGVSERSVRIIEAEEPITQQNAESRPSSGAGRPSKAEKFREFVRNILEKDSDLMSLELMRRARLDGYVGGKSAFYELVAELRPARQKMIMRFEGIPGEFSQHDFGQVDVRFIDESVRRIHFFASRLKYSRWAQVTIVDNQQVESLVRALIEHFAIMGGIPLMAVFDRPKTIAIAWKKNGEVTEWNSTFAYVALELSLGVELCWPHQPQQKGSVENLVGWVKGSFFKQRRFLDDEDLKRQLAEWHIEVNTKTPSRATGVIPEIRLAQERSRLRPLKVAPENLALRMPIYVSATATILHDTHIYSMPPEACGISGTLYLYRDRVRIVVGRWDVTHPRLFEKNAKSTLPEHRAERVAAVSGKRGKRYLKRQDLMEVGASALEYLTEIVHRRPRSWSEEVDKLHELLQNHGEQPLRCAFQRAVTDKTFGVEYIHHYLQNPVPAARRVIQEELPL